MSVTNSATELSGAIVELEQLRQQAKHPKNQQWMDEELRKWRANLEEIKHREALANQRQESGSTNSMAQQRPVKKLANYAFDESDKFVKLYYTIHGISKAPADSINTKFDENSFDVRCANIAGIDYEISVRGLYHPVDPTKCQVKQKSEDLLLVMLKKAKEHENWGSLLKLEKKEKTKVPKMEEDDDPQASLMKMMKQMYDDGDDEMKRTIRKAWTEAQTKKNTLGDSLDD